MRCLNLSETSARSKSGLLVALILIALGGAPAPSQGQAPPPPDSANVPTTNVLLTGYATVDYESTLTTEYRNNFGALFAPVTLFQVGPSFLFEGEMDLELEGGTTNLTLEHAQIHYLADRFQLTAGQFHLPLGLWMHQDWINRMPSPPLLYGHAHDGLAERALLPIPFDLGVMGKSKASLGNGWSLLGRVWLTQGPRTATEEGGHGHDSAPSEPGNGENGHHEAVVRPLHTVGITHTLDIPSVAYGINHHDNNANKMVGGRVTVMGPSVRAHVAGWHAAYNETGDLATQAGNISALLQPGSWDLRGEVILIRQEIRDHEAIESFTKGGYYLQAARRIGPFEPVLRWSHLPEATYKDQTLAHTHRQLAAGLNYWIRPSMPLKLAYELQLDGRPDRARLAWTIGF